MKTERSIYWVAVLLSVFLVSSAPAQERGRDVERRGWGPPREHEGEAGRFFDKSPSEQAERFFDALDADGDGRVNKDEFVDRVPRIMERMQQMRQGNREGRQDRGFRGPGGPMDGPGGGPMASRRPQAQERGGELAEMIERAVRKALQEQQELYRGPQAGPRPRSYGFQRPGIGRDDRGSGSGKGCPEFDRPGRGSRGGPGDRFERPRMGGRGSGRPGWGRDGQQGYSRRQRAYRGSDREPRRLGIGRKGSDARGPMGILDANRDGKIQKAEVQRLRDMLSRIIDETEGDVVEREQFRRMFGERQEREAPQREAARPEDEKAE